MGYDVWPVNTVQFSNHTGYGKWQGIIFSKEHIGNVIQGIEDLGVADRCAAILSGYMGSSEICQEVYATAKRFKARNANVLYLCDPVIGNNSCFVKPEVLHFFKSNLQADIITPNQFEAETLSGISINNAQDRSLVSIPGIAVKPEISGRITKIYFKSGDSVTIGAPLIEINPDLIRAQLADAQAQSQLTKLQFGRFAELYKTHDVSKDDYDKAQANYVSAQAKVENMQAQLRQTNIVAPFSGKLGLCQINLGDYVNAGQTVLVNLQSLDPLRVDFSIPETYLSKVAIGQTVLLHSD